MLTWFLDFVSEWVSRWYFFRYSISSRFFMRYLFLSEYFHVQPVDLIFTLQLPPFFGMKQIDHEIFSHTFFCSDNVWKGVGVYCLGLTHSKILIQIILDQISFSGFQIKGVGNLNIAFVFSCLGLNLKDMTCDPTCEKDKIVLTLPLHHFNKWYYF